MTKISAILSLLAASASSVSAYNAKVSLSGAAAKVEKSESAAATAGRRDFLASAATTAASLAFGLPVAASLVANPQPANAGAASDLTDVYFGVGCFWHIQVRAFRIYLFRLFIEVEELRRILTTSISLSLHAARICRGRAKVVGPWR